jgi:hypothetical protein
MKELNMVQINDEGKHGKGTQLITLHYHDWSQGRKLSNLGAPH